MRKGKFTDGEMVKILREAERSSVAEVAKKCAVSEQTLYVWRKRFGAMSVDEVKRLKALEAENTRLKKLLAESQLPTKSSRRWPQTPVELPHGPAILGSA